ncbi:MAG TPA: hypothetical protein VGI81_11650 [Tepidisphaeraceae bacterium]|jgi:hypothetical protein
MKSRTLWIAVVAIAGFASGCASYYKVTDPNTKTIYYTDKYDRQQSGVIVFKDAKTSNEVTLPASQIQKISKEQYDTGRYSETATQAKAPS